MKINAKCSINKTENFSEIGKLEKACDGREITHCRNSNKKECQSLRRSQRLTKNTFKPPQNELNVDLYAEKKDSSLPFIKLEKNENEYQSDICKTEMADDFDIRAGKILGATTTNGKLQYIIKWVDKMDPIIVSSEEAKINYPYIVLEFYESRMKWYDIHEGSGNAIHDRHLDAKYSKIL